MTHYLSPVQQQAHQHKSGLVSEVLHQDLRVLAVSRKVLQAHRAVGARAGSLFLLVFLLALHQQNKPAPESCFPMTAH